MLNTDTINKILGITDSYQAPQAMLNKMLDDEQRIGIFDEFLECETDLSYEWFHDYFENEHADRKIKKQDFTPHSVSNLLSILAGKNNSYFEAAAGTGGIMIQSWLLNQNVECWYQVEELSERSIPFLIFNMAIRGMKGIVLKGDSLTGEFEVAYELIRNGKYSNVRLVEISKKEHGFEAVLMNPPYSANWSADNKFLSDPRFKQYEKLAPKSKADFSFLLHGFYHLNEKGTMGIVLPHGVLFRGASEGVIRKTLLGMGAIEAVIGLPANIFYGTSIPTVVLILKKNRDKRDILFIDASKDFEKQKNQNLMRSQDIKKIVDTYKNRSNIPKYSHLAEYDEIVRNDYNLNLPRYVDTFEEEESIDIVALSREITDLNLQIKQKESEFLGLLDKLAITDETQELIEATKCIFTS